MACESLQTRAYLFDHDPDEFRKSSVYGPNAESSEGAGGLTLSPTAANSTSSPELISYFFLGSP